MNYFKWKKHRRKKKKKCFSKFKSNWFITEPSHIQEIVEPITPIFTHTLEEEEQVLLFFFPFFFFSLTSLRLLNLKWTYWIELGE